MEAQQPEPEPEPDRGTDAEAQVRPLTRNPSEIPSDTPMGTLRERLDSVGRLAAFEAAGARRRRQRALNPQVLTDDVYRARQRLMAQKVINEYAGGRTISKLTGEEHSNPTVEAMGGQIGRMVVKAPRPIARDASGNFVFVDTNKEVVENTPL